MTAIANLVDRALGFPSLARRQLTRPAHATLAVFGRLLCVAGEQQRLGDSERRALAYRRLLQAASVAMAEAALFLTVKGLLAAPWLFKKDLGIAENSELEGIKKFAGFMASLSSPLLVALAAIAPIALLFGAGAMMLGHRRALAIIAATFGALVLGACATGLVN